jgi:hypothetical protein
MAKAKRVSIALLAPGFALALLVPLAGVIAMIVGGVILAIALEEDLAAAERVRPAPAGAGGTGRRDAHSDRQRRSRRARTNA